MKKLLIPVLVILLVLTSILGYRWCRRPVKTALKPVAVCGRAKP